MLAQKDAEVIVVDFSCPQNTGDFVRQNFPAVKVVMVPDKSYFSNWEARNAGANVAKGEVLVFCDADTVLAPHALVWIEKNVAKTCFGFFATEQSLKFKTDDLVISRNQLKGFQVVPVQSFKLLGGYDEILQGYAAGGDTDLQDRCELISVPTKELDAGIIAEVMNHDNETRLTFHQSPLRQTYLVGLLYRRAKLTLMQMYHEVQTPLHRRKELYEAAQKASLLLEQGKSEISITIELDNQHIGMPRELGYQKGTCSVSILVQASLHEKIDQADVAAIGT